jgi:hypothetical protein
MVFVSSDSGFCWVPALAMLVLSRFSFLSSLVEQRGWVQWEQRGIVDIPPWGCGFLMLVTISPLALLQRFLAKGTLKPQHLIKFMG